jgi:hypothetical protein
MGLYISIFDGDDELDGVEVGRREESPARSAWTRRLAPIAQRYSTILRIRRSPYAHRSLTRIPFSSSMGFSYIEPNSGTS